MAMPGNKIIVLNNPLLIPEILSLATLPPFLHCYSDTNGHVSSIDHSLTKTFQRSHHHCLLSNGELTREISLEKNPLLYPDHLEMVLTKFKNPTPYNLVRVRRVRGVGKILLLGEAECPGQSFFVVSTGGHRRVFSRITGPVTVR